MEVENITQDNDMETPRSNSDGQHTPPIDNKSVVVPDFQKQLEQALTIVSPEEKIARIRNQARLNASKQKLQHGTTNTEQDTTSSPPARQTDTTKPPERSAINTASKKMKQPMVIKEGTHNHATNKSSASDYAPSGSSSDDSDSSDPEITEILPNPPPLKNRTGKKPKAAKTINITRTYNTFYSVKLHVEKGAVPTKQLIASLQKWYKQLQAIDPSLIVFAFDNELPTKAILSPKQIPNDIYTLKRYFSNISVRPQGGHTWFQTWLGHDESPSNVSVNMKYWSTENDSYLYEKRLQEKYTTKDYWLMWSTERMDPNKLHAEVSQQLKLLTNKEYTFCFHFGMLRKNTTYEKTTSTKWNKAMLVEVKKEEKDAIYRLLGRIFSSSRNKKFLGTTLRMIPVLNHDLPTHTKMKVIHLINKQEQFLSSLLVKPCPYLSEIDYHNKDLNTSMREIIMNLETLRTFDKDGQSKEIFINVDFSNWHKSYVLTFPKHLEQEADDYISQLPTYLHHVYGDTILSMLTTEGASQATSSQWDEEKLCAISHLDLELDAVFDEADSKDWLQNDKFPLIQFDHKQLSRDALLHTKATDADSVSTFRSNQHAHVVIKDSIKITPQCSSSNNNKTIGDTQTPNDLMAREPSHQDLSPSRNNGRVREDSL